MKTVQEILQLSTDYLKKKGINPARRQAEELLCDVLDLDRMRLYLEFERPLNDKEMETCRSWLARRSNGEPLAYIRGSIEFYGCQIEVSPAVLIPRQETEILVDRLVTNLKGTDLKGKALWDLCCGSGCIGIAIKKALPDLTVVLSDLSPQAIEMAHKNAAENQADVTILQGDLWAPFKGMQTDYLVCNPPYISENEMSKLSPEVSHYEPGMALYGGKEGLDFYERLAKGLHEHLKPDGQAWFEIGYQQGESVQQLFAKYKTKIEKDWAGHDRFLLVHLFP